MTDTQDQTAQNLWMQEAIALSFQAMQDGGGPYGAVIVRNGEMIGSGMNQVTIQQDPTAHAELLAIQQACKRLGTWNLNDCELYTSCEPCPMCLGAIYWAQIQRVYFGNSKEDAARYGFNSGAIYEQIALPKEQRQIAMVPLIQQEAIAAFEAWADKTDKQPY